jgi:hypothetical protein
MPKAASKKIRWLADAEEHNYPAARSYLGLLYPDNEAKRLVKRLRASAVAEFKAKDIFRASRLSLLGVSNTHIARDRSKIAAGERLSPLLLVRDRRHGWVVIADGYHRLCAVYERDEDAWIPCKII